jgi:hypothetical protein
VLHEEDIGVLARAAVLGGEMKIYGSSWGCEFALGELISVDSGSKEIRIGLLPAYVHSVRYFGRRAIRDYYHAPCATFMVDAYIGGCAWAWATGETR